MIKLYKSNILGAGLAVIAALSLSVSMAITKHLDPAIPTSLVVFIRSCFGFLFFLPILFTSCESVAKSKKLHLHILRIILGVASMLCTYYAYRTLPVAFATAIGMTAPLFVAILSFVFLKEKISFLKWGLIFLGYIGVLLVMKPCSFIIDTGTASALAANILAACCIILIKVLSRYDSTVTIMLHTNIGMTFGAFLLNIQGWPAIHTCDIILMSLTGLLGTITQFCSISALKHASPTAVAPFEYTRIIFALLIGIIIFNEKPDIYMIIGTIVIIISAYLITCLQFNNSKTN